eukprot:CAMPEP_0179445908 /NCGR_PEP_ID=MMETSP0799-20121207/29356_1 /TAXON_ID=46947 /ORGANISM="Geminigera cryophila, Strain CCMP2564" /LENGTH=165 /DNA_ID=CAMNT_0021234425 /DNA_START=17 /DNA_END=515 /DNA_ORIENTATION=-
MNPQYTPGFTPTRYVPQGAPSMYSPQRQQAQQQQQGQGQQNGVRSSDRLQFNLDTGTERVYGAAYSSLFSERSRPQSPSASQSHSTPARGQQALYTQREVSSSSNSSTSRSSMQLQQQQQLQQLQQQQQQLQQRQYAFGSSGAHNRTSLPTPSSPSTTPPPPREK